MKHLKRLLLVFPILLFACSPTVVEVTNTPVPTAPTLAPEPTAEPVEVEAGADETVVEAAVSEEVAASEEPADTDEEEVAQSAATFTVDPALSTLTWTGAKAVGSSHTGTIDLNDGELIVEGDTLLSGMFTIDMTTIHEGSVRLESHLKSDDFFGVDTYPTATLDILETTADSAETYTVRANLTIKDITNEITFPATATIDGNTLTANADVTFDRSLWNVQYGSGSFFNDLGNDLINDDIDMVIELVATQ